MLVAFIFVLHVQLRIRALVLQVKTVFVAFGCLFWVSGLVSYPPGPILESVFLWRVSVDGNLPVPHPRSGMVF